MRDFVEAIRNLGIPRRILQLKEKMLDEKRYLSLEQARIITAVYKENEKEPANIKRALSLKEALNKMEIKITPGELIVGNRTAGVRGGVVFPESGVSWLDEEIESLENRVQDKFAVNPEDIELFRETILPYWKGRSLEDSIKKEIGKEVSAISRVVKINQKYHAQGHICPNTKKWLELGPAGLKNRVEKKIKETGDPNHFYEGMVFVLEGVSAFMVRYADLAEEMAGDMKNSADSSFHQDLLEVARICRKISIEAPETYHEALQSLWFLYAVLHMESNASSFSPGRMDQYLYPYYKKDFDEGKVNYSRALELTEALWLKFNQVVYMRNSNSARYFAGFPIGFNVAVGGQDAEGKDSSNELSFIFLKAQEHIGLPQPNLSARLFEGSKEDFIFECSRVIGKGSGMPQVFNDEAVIPALKNQGISEKDARNYAIVGCVELTTHGTSLGWSDAAMFNLVKALELTLTGGECLIDKKIISINSGSLDSYKRFDELEEAFKKQINFFTFRMIKCCEVVERLHAEILPSPFLSTVIDDCIDRGIDVTEGGAHYNLSGIQAIQVANIADSLAAVKKLVFDEKSVSAAELLRALRENFKNNEVLRLQLLNNAPKYGNDIEWVDKIGNKWIAYFTAQLKKYRNRRGGPYHVGLYTVSAHVPMGKNVGASPDGRIAEAPLADGGMSAVYGRDTHGPTALLKSVSRINSMYGSNGTLLNMKFLPDLFAAAEGINKFSAMLRAFVALKIIHVQFNVVRREDLIAARENPEAYRNLTIRVAGYTAYFTELAGDLQEEIIARTTYTEAG